MTRPRPEGPAGASALRPEIERVAGAVLAGALFAGASAAALGLTLDLLSPAGAAGAAASRLREFLNTGGWVRLPLWGGALGALRARHAARR